MNNIIYVIIDSDRSDKVIGFTACVFYTLRTHYKGSKRVELFRVAYAIYRGSDGDCTLIFVYCASCTRVSLS